ncbi:MAG TPA: M24 family metallopeptidase, partial [Candidatus Omnitrophica bacterium]|nr:M24 family metallopeptidase [Candidatus Omnitrophota bacterium]
MIILKTPEQIEGIREASKIVAKTLEMLKDAVCVGVATEDLDRKARDFIRNCGAEPAFLGYKGYPKSICTSINEEVVHGIPSARRLKEGDIISIDVGVKRDGFYSDAAITVGVGRIGPLAEKLIKSTEEALYDS